MRPTWRQFPAPLSLCGLEHGTDLSISTSWCAGQGRPHGAGSPNWVMFFLPHWTITAASVFKVRTVLAGRCLPGTTHFQFLPLCLAWPGSRGGGGVSMPRRGPALAPVSSLGPRLHQHVPGSVSQLERLRSLSCHLKRVTSSCPTSGRALTTGQPPHPP